jgi:hypothetical protein
MAISYSRFGITITDDRNPSRPPLVLPATATSSEVAAAAAEYAPSVPEPDYQGFYNSLLASNTYKEVLTITATADLARSLAVFVSAIQDAMAGRVNPSALQGAIWLLLSQINLSAGSVNEISSLMRAYHLDKTYSLSAPATLVRARDESGQFLPDDPSTPDVNEAWMSMES